MARQELPLIYRGLGSAIGKTSASARTLSTSLRSHMITLWSHVSCNVISIHRVAQGDDGTGDGNDGT